MRLKIRDSHLTCKVANKCLNVREWVEVVEWNKRWSPPSPCYPVNRQCLKEIPDRKKKSQVGFSESRKLLRNFYSRRWLKTSLQSLYTIRGRSNKFKNLFFKYRIRSELRIFKSNFNPSGNIPSLRNHKMTKICTRLPSFIIRT